MKRSTCRSHGNVRKITVNPRGVLLAIVVAISPGLDAWAGLDEGMAAYQRGDYQTALRELQPLAERGVFEAQFVLGVMYGDGQGVAKNSSESLKWLRRAADQGYADAQVALGSRYSLGWEGVPEDDAEAVKWYRRAAEQGNSVAQHNLGSMYSVGRGVAQDYVLAYMWWSLYANSLPAGEVRDRAVSKGDRILPRMTKDQIAKAKDLARKFVPRQERAAFPLPGATPSISAAAANKIVPPGGTIDGKTIAEFAAEWWKWSQSVPEDQDPVDDETGRHCAVGQRGPIWFLAGGYDSSKKQRACEVPSGKYIFFPVINKLAWPRDRDRHFSCDDAKRKAAIADERTVELFVVIDGSALDDVKRFRASSDKCFNMQEWIAPGRGTHDAYPSATDGYWIMLEPMSEGQHSIAFGGRRSGETIQDIRYQLTIK
ncbi:MAG TPA: tetratricopeptide repeat protein [Candidatus Polarisedimenticolia bacterium]|jgi:hypothetical protein|nr:tetratricopeptide repeat protein [Candidatus Polarisedimenticolia bacterium]